MTDAVKYEWAIAQTIIEVVPGERPNHASALFYEWTHAGWGIVSVVAHATDDPTRCRVTGVARRPAA